MVIVRTTIQGPTTTALLLGVATVVTQSVLLREAMAAMGGSEMAWGLVMALWLIGVSLGARLGVHRGTASVAEWLPPVAVVLAGLGTLIFRAAPAILGATAGESLTTGHAVWLWTSAVAPCAVTAGLAFPVVAGEFGSSGAGRAYAYEAAGGLIGGMAFTFVLAPAGTMLTLLITLTAVAGPLLWRLHPFAAVAFGVIGIGAASPAENLLAEAGWSWSGRAGTLANRAETRSQRLEVSEGPPIALYGNGRLAASYPDPWTVEPRAHLLMLLHPQPKRVLSIGAAADGTIEALADHDLQELVIAEDDPDLIPLLARWYGGDFAEVFQLPHIQISAGDPIEAVTPQSRFDLILVVDGDPTTLRANRTRTLEFFQRCRESLDPLGMLVVEVGVTDTYLGGEAGRLLASIAGTLSEIFPCLRAVPGEHVLLIAGGESAEITTDVDVLIERLEDRPGIAARIPSAMVPVLVDEARQASLDGWLATTTARLNTTTHPRSVAIATALHEARSHPSLARLVADADGIGRRGLVGLWILAIAAALASAVTPRCPLQLTAAAVIVGSSSMGWWLLLLAAWQATRGSVFAEIGVLTGLFMAGVALGGRLGISVEKERRFLVVFLALGVGISLAIAIGLPVLLPIPFVPGLLFLGGLSTGAAFPIIATAVGSDEDRRGAGIAFSADELGAAAAALIIGTVAVSWVGMTATAFGLAGLSLAAMLAAARSS
jgi:spermidine synthase